MRSHARHHHVIRASFAAVGAASAMLLTFLSVLPNIQTAQAATPGIFPARLGVANAALPTTQLANGTMVISRFSLKNNADEEARPDQLSFILTTRSVRSSRAAFTPVTISNVSVRKVGDATNIASATVSECVPISSTQCRIVVHMDDVSIPGNVTQTFELRADFAGVDIAGESNKTILEKDRTVTHFFSFPAQPSTPVYESGLSGGIGSQLVSRS
jgi:hypothetical protein